MVIAEALNRIDSKDDSRLPAGVRAGTCTLPTAPPGMTLKSKQRL